MGSVMKPAMLSAALLLAACETLPGGDAAGTGGAIASAPISLGEWRTATEAATLAAFEQEIGARYAGGLAVSAVRADLRRNDFACAPNTAPYNGRGDPADEMCRRSETVGSCTHTWQVHLFENAETLERARGIYDRRCGAGGDGLLGGPG